MNEPGHAQGWTNKGSEMGRLAKHDFFLTHIAQIELRWCSECGQVLAYCRMHGGEMYCKFCGVIL